MYITTLEVIHQLLQKEAERTEKAADAARKLLHRYEADDAAHTLIEEQKPQRMRLMRKRLALLRHWQISSSQAGVEEEKP